MADLQYPFVAQQQVGGLEVTVQNPVVMEMVNST